MARCPTCGSEGPWPHDVGPHQAVARGTVRLRGVALAAAAGAGATLWLVRNVLSLQARSARAEIGKPLGEEALAGDRVFKKKYGDRIDLLLLGDSLAAGLGADRHEDTLGGQLGKRLARKTRRSVQLHTAAVVGSESSALAAQLDGLPAGYSPDVAVIVVGGNDVTHRVRPSVSTGHLADALRRLRVEEVEVVVGTCPDLSALLPLRQPLRALAGRASRRLAAEQVEVATAHGARAVSLAHVVGPFFLTQPDQMFSVDRFHPSGAGYRRTAKALLPSVLAAIGELDAVPFGHHAPQPPEEVPAPAPADR